MSVLPNPSSTHRMNTCGPPPSVLTLATYIPLGELPVRGAQGVKAMGGGHKGLKQWGVEQRVKAMGEGTRG